MRFFSKWLFRIRALLFPKDMEEVLDHEVAFHLEMEAKKLIRQGMPPDEAFRKARRDFGEPEYHKEKAREAWGIGMFQNFKIDVRHTLRVLRRNPVFAAVSILTLGLGIGANSAIFSVVNGILFRDLPFQNPEQLVSICEARPDEANRCVTASTPNVTDLAEQTNSFSDIGVFRWWGHILETPEGAESVESLIATPDFFRVMEYRPAVGRLLQEEDQWEGQRNVAVLDYDFWQTRFGADPGVVESTIMLSGEPFQVVGVMQPGQKPPAMGGEPDADVWLPLHFDPRDNERRDWRGFYTVGRLLPDATLDVGAQELLTAGEGLKELYPEANRDWDVQAITLHERVVGRVKNTLFLFLGAVGLVLLITCANIANLILARLSSRETELGIRTALGAGTSRLTGQLLTEGLVLALLGGSLGIIVAWVGTPLFLALAPAGIPRLYEVAIDGQVFLFTLGLALLATLLFGIAPMTTASRVRPMEALRTGRHGTRKGVLGGMKGALVISEVALALALLVGAGLLTRSFASFYRWDPGFDKDNILVMSASVMTGAYQGSDAILGIYRTLDDELQSLPGVRSVGRTSAGPLFGGFEPDLVLPADQAGSGDPGIQARWYDVSPSYFEALGVPILQGRPFGLGDNMDGPRVVVINESLANRLFPGENPIGQSIWMEMHDGVREVIGVVRDIPPLNPDGRTGPEMYWPQAQYTRPFSYFVVRTEGDPAPLQRQVVERIEAVDPDIQVGAVQDYDALLARRLVQPRFNMALLGVFSAVALILAGVGIFGVVSRSVAARTREIGIRIALGARRSSVVRQVVTESVVVVAVGVGVGLGLALILSRFIRGFIYGIVPTDPITYGSVSLILFMVAVLASFIPALTASRVDPMNSLREE